MGGRRHYNGGRNPEVWQITLERQFWRGCNGKVRYTSKKQARGGLRATIKGAGGVVKGRDPEVGVGTYKCKSCHGWHIGHRPKPRPPELVES